MDCYVLFGFLVGGNFVVVVNCIDCDIEIALDSGCSDHVMDVEECAPGYQIVESPGSKRGGGFIVGNGERVLNEGQSSLLLESSSRLGGTQQFNSVLQAARISRPLMSVSKICQNGFKCVFNEDEAQVLDAQNRVACVFAKKGGLYVTRMKLKAPPPFTGPA